MQVIKRIFVLPPMESEYEKQSARVLQAILVFFGCATIAYFGLCILTDFPHWGRYVAQSAVLLAAMALGMFFLRQGRLRLVANLEILIIWLVFATAAYTAGGVISSGYFGFLVVLVVAGVVSGRRLDTLVVAVFSAVAGYYFVYAEAHGLLPPSRIQLTSFAVWIDSLVYFVVVAGLLVMVMRLQYNALMRAEAELQERKRVEQREEYRHAMLEKVLRLGKVVTEAADFHTVLLRIWNGIRAELDFDRVGIFICDPGSHSMQGSYGTDRAGKRTEEWHLRFPLDGDNFFSSVLEQRDGFFFTEAYENERFYRPEENMAGVKHFAAVSAWSGEKPIAIICVDQLISGQPINQAQLEALRLFAGYAGQALGNALQDQREKKRREMLEKVIRLGKLVTSETDFRAVLLKIWQGIRGELGFDRVGLFIYDANRQIMQGSYGTDRNGNFQEEWNVSFPASGSDFFASVLSRPDGYYVTQDYEKDRQIRPNHAMSGVKHYAAVSAWAGDKPVALITTDQLTSGRPVTDEQLEALRLFAGYAGLALQNADRYSREKARQDMLEKVIRLGKLVTESTDYQTVLLRIWNSVHSDLDFDRVGIFTYEASRDILRGAYGTDRHGNIVEEWQIELPAQGNDYFGGALNRLDGFYYTDDYARGRNLKPGDIMVGVKDYAAVSAWVGDKPVALLCVDQLTSGRPITADQVEILRLFSGYIGPAIENARLNAGLEQRVSERTTELEVAFRELAEAFRLQAEAERRAAGLRQKLLDFNQKLLSSVDASEVLETIRLTASDLVPHDVFSPFWVDEVRQILVPAEPHGRNWFSEPFKEWVIPFGQGLIGNVAQTLQPECVNNSHLDPRAVFPPWMPKEQIKSEHGIFLPVQSDDKAIGLLAFIRHTLPPFTQDDFELAQLLLSQARLALRNARMFTELEASNRELEAFSYMVSHDLRAPLRAINGFAKILEDDFGTELSSPAHGFLERIRTSGNKMNTLIDGLLNLSRLGRKPLQKQEVDTQATVRLIIDALGPETAGRQIEWILGDLPTCHADRVLIDQVFVNLISNAVKYTRKHATARIEIGSLAQNGELIFFVRDNGAGFDMKFADRLFGVFQRLHRDEDFEGTGIGLAIVKRIIQRHGGRIWAEAEPDKGAAFFFTLQ